MSEKTLKSIYAAIDDLNETLPASDAITKSPETNLYGGDGDLDSLGLVQLIVNIEKYIYRDFSKALVLADDKALSMKNSPFRNIKTLSSYIEGLLHEE